MEYKKRAKSLIDRVGEYRADLTDILSQLEEIRVSCMEGMVSEKVNTRSDEGKVLVIEVFPAVALAAVLGKLTVYKELSRLAEMEVVDPTVTVSISLESLEDSR
jgi:hypothetical protein